MMLWNKVKVHNVVIFGVDNTMEFRLENQSNENKLHTWKIEKLAI
nr:hypothetical protein [Mycoplasmopsis bovis]